ncbi:MAG: phosphate ABC transporter permease PstA [Gemmatimonadetes bacterium]|nr:phosphate ABC transporter permease PstA [Gemmatimonadota bacterium]
MGARPVSGAVPVSGPSRLSGRRTEPRRVAGAVFAGICVLATLVGVAALAVLLADVVADGYRHVDRGFFTRYASRFPERAGIKAALWGSVWILALTAMIAFPLAIGAAVYLEEYAPRNWITRAIQTNIGNLAGVPSIVYGILGLAFFVRALALGRSVISGALTLALLILPTLIISAQEAIRAVPDSIRHAAYALGATRWQVVRGQVLPLALPGILTGTILALSRAVGETAPLIMIGALTFIAFTPKGPMDPFTALPIQIFNWVSRPQAEFQALAAAAILVLLAMLLTMNAAAIVLRNRAQRRF